MLWKHRQRVNDKRGEPRCAGGGREAVADAARSGRIERQQFGEEAMTRILLVQGANLYVETTGPSR